MAYGDLTHKGCGGEVIIGNPEKYDYTYDDGHTGKVPELVCRKCGVEVTGDPDIDFDEGGEA
jgi:hypothetical protein